MSHDPSVTLDALRARDQAGVLLARLHGALEESAAHPAHKRERRWLEEASELLKESCAALDPILSESERLPERESERPAFARVPQGHWVDALERLYSGIAYHLGPRAPVLEALFPHAKFAVLRKPKQDVVRSYWEAFSKRRQGSYVARIFAEREAAFVLPLLAEADASLAAWEQTLTGPPLEEEQAAAIRDRIVRGAERLAKAHKQAKHLLEAAALGLPDVAPAKPATPIDVESKPVEDPALLPPPDATLAPAAEAP